MTGLTAIMAIIKLLDMVHDLLCPFFNDNASNEDLDKVMNKLTDIESLIMQIKEKKK